MIDKQFDTAVIGGGLAGLSVSIVLAQKGFKVVLLEKESYPFHKVCGEYISMESWNFMESLGLSLAEMNLPKINHLVVSAPGGKTLQQKLEPGGFGISRFFLDNELKKISEMLGVVIMDNCKVSNINFDQDQFIISTSGDPIKAKTCCGSFGKRANLDVKWRRPFVQAAANKLNNYIGVKYHIEIDFPANQIALHNFKNGYCGISKIEGNKYCLCYLTTASNLKECGNSIEQMEKHILSGNPHLKQILASAKRLYNSPLTISQVSFQEKNQVEQHVLLLGDAAGLITPLCGNGMSIAMNSARLAAGFIDQFLLNKISRVEMENSYTTSWKNEFKTRLKIGRLIQSFFGGETSTNMFISVMKLFPGLTRALISKTHGDSF